ncbi:probable cyclin-dependent serine/threonine-protein kinase DDB_G0292550 [Culicoides brevitarsis]|uniref:probable cyclin-dependent serine/threonine-protein kinase DDB_G0292550 n=1 Tax=Culicoides brevitarsis TaxID=469753 RepID=UPI00307B27A9
MDLYNEPLNLSVRSKPVAVVPPSSSTKNLDERGSPPRDFHSDEPEDDDSTSDTQTENIKTASSNNNESSRGVAAAEPNLVTVTSLANNGLLEPKMKQFETQSDDEEDEDSDSRNTSPASVPYQKSAISAILTAYMENFHEHQQSLDAAKLHLQQYLKLTNQYLQKYAELVPSGGAGDSATTTTTNASNAVGTNINNNNNNNNNNSNDTINNIIHTNILTNKITTNNLISIINKLLEQNIVSEFYFKHATAFQEQQKLRQDIICHDELDYDGPKGGGGGGTMHVMGNGAASMMGMATGGMLGGMLLDHLSLNATRDNNNGNGASGISRHQQQQQQQQHMLSDNNNSSSSSSLMTATNSVLGGITGLAAPLFMNQSHASKLKTMKNLAMIARER